MCRVNVEKESRLSHAALLEALSYDRETGVFRWERDSVRRRAGDVAGSKFHKRGYIMIRVGYDRFLAHRLAWFYVYGQWPVGEIDHINHDTSDNRLSNIRDVTRKENCWNSSVRNQNSLNIKHISRYKRGLQLYIVRNGETVVRKHFRCLGKALKARDAALMVA